MRIARRAKGVFSQRLIQLRTARGLTQERLAEELDVTRDVIAYYETRATNPTMDFVKKAASFFGVAVDQLLGAQQKWPKPGPVSKLERQFELVRQLPQQQQKAIVTVLDMALQNVTGTNEVQRA